VIVAEEVEVASKLLIKGRPQIKAGDVFEKSDAG